MTGDRRRSDISGHGLPDQAVTGGDDAWIGIDAAARHLAIPVRTMYRLAQLRQVPGAKVGRTWRFKRSVLDAHLETAMAAAAPTPPPAAGAPLRAAGAPLPVSGASRRATGAPPPAAGAPHRRARVLLRTSATSEPSVALDRDDQRPHAALADVSAGLAALSDPSEIAGYLDATLRDLFGADLVALLRLDGRDLVTLTGTDRLGVAQGMRFSLEAGSPLLAALERDEPFIVDDLARHAAGDSPVIRRFGVRSLACIPIRLAGVTWGVLAVASLAPGALAAGDLARLRSIASQAGLALHRTLLFRETLRWSEQLERIEALSRQLNRSRDVAAVAEAVASHIDSVIDWHGLRFYLLASDGRTLEPIKLACKDPHYATHTPERVRLRLGQGLGGHIAASGVAEVINDAAHDPRTRRIPGTDDIDESMIVVPLRYEDTVLGVLELFRLGCDAFDATDLRLAQIVGAQASVAIVNARQVEELERRSTSLERRLASQRQLLAITERLLLHREGGAVFEAIADTLAEVVPHDTLTIYLVDRAAGCLVPALARDEYAAEIMASSLALGTGITGDVIAKGEAEIVNDADADPRTVHVPGTPVEQAEAMIVAPIRTSEGVIGALNLYRAKREFAADDLELVRLFTNHVAIALENASIHDRLVEAAVTDPLTGLPNRRLFTDRVDHALLRRVRSGRGVAVLFLDLDGFKLVNDSLGHAAGDEVLAAVATRLRTCLRAIDTVARLGGDEFAILFEDVEGEADALEAAERVTVALAEPLALPDRTVSVRASVGVALDRGDARISAIDLLRNADTAMYQAKANGRGRTALFEPAMHARQLARLELEGELRDALARGQFRLVYQPIVALATGRVVGAEALLRWDRPAAPLGPQEFIALAEETGDIVPIGRWVLSEACRQASAWQHAAGGADFMISVNTSARELAEASFVDDVTQALREAGLAPDRLTLEITESVMLADETAAITTLRRLRAAGIHVAVDDFGTGYSSLGYLNRLPVDGLKIDRSFVAGLGPGRGKSAIVSATLSFARALGLEVTAEGVETPDQFRRLQELRCALAQGYLFSAPLPPEAMSELLRSNHRYPVPPRPRTFRAGRAA